MFAVIRTGGKQYRVAPGDVLEIERLPGEAGASITFSEVLVAGSKIGAPLLSGASVAAEIVAQDRAPKVVAFKKKRRKNTHRKRGHRQLLTRVKINSISAG
ncbi:MAG TPA: 50S ribosomal protein L21 [Micropepsaceae bacterium]|jgi:large subunit ribosomal protein L21|nr:large subunit ribosomal protein [Alphaproteobacteria bacterium]HYK80687.1 50S ribosomal protein L21 [Micropepsaceae bacterium]